MARTPRRVRSTQSVELPSSPVETTATPGRPESTNAVEDAHAEPVETRATHLDESVTVRSELPEPFTASVGWLAEAEAKVVTPTEPRPEPKSSTVEPETKGSSDEPGTARDA